jgi:hypothetical protein
MKKMTMAVIILGSLTASATRLTADEEPALAAGATVRVTAQEGVALRGVDPSSRQLVGRLAAIEGDDLLIAHDGAPDLRISQSAIDRLEVSIGRASAGKRLLNGAGQGLCIGVVPALALYLAARKDLGWRLVGAYGVQYGVVVGPVLGAIIGVVSKGERWERVSAHEPARLSLDVIPARKGAGLSVRYAF